MVIKQGFPTRGWPRKSGSQSKGELQCKSGSLSKSGSISKSEPLSKSGSDPIVDFKAFFEVIRVAKKVDYL